MCNTFDTTRYHAYAVASSSGIYYIAGGHGDGLYAPRESTVHADVWLSYDLGVTWKTAGKRLFFLT